MTVYWLLFAYFAFGALLVQMPPSGSVRNTGFMFALGGVIVAAIVGLRFEVGADWDAYEFIFNFAGRTSFWNALDAGDPGYQAVNWFVYQLGVGVWLVNLLCAIIFAWGLFRFCAVQREPWIAVLASICYTVLVVAMGYTRQGVALGVIMAGLASVIRGGSAARFAIYVAVAALFHKTAVTVFPIVALAMARNRPINILLIIFTSVLFYDLFLGNAMDEFVEHYIHEEYSSQGAIIRVSMSVAAAIVFMLGSRHFEFDPLENRLWWNFSFAAFALLVFLLVSPSSTAVDRLSLYVLPLQFAVLSSLPQLTKSRSSAAAMAVTFVFLVQFVWLNYAEFARLWIPYRFYPL